jgi:uncharacterized cupin superfamily protein
MAVLPHAMMPMMVVEARLVNHESGLAPAGSGWFVVNARDAVWEVHAIGAACCFESEHAPFEQLGVNLRVLWPGRSTWLYHSEPYQEDFLVIAGECLLLVEEEERPLRAWDFVHCPAGAAHAFVATGDRPCIMVMVGSRDADWPRGIVYPRSELALRHGVGVETETTSQPEAFADPSGWRQERPEGWDELPWA